MPNKYDAPPDQAEEDDPPYRTLTAEEAQRLRQGFRRVTPWMVVAWQVVVGLVVALAAWGVTGKPNVGWSAAYGALAVVLPAAIFARGMTSPLSSRNAGAAAVGFMLWEMLKIALSIAMLVAAPRWVAGLSWPALLAGMVFAMKVNWVALAFVPRAKVQQG